MPELKELSKQGNSLEQIVNLLYNTGYRLTGSHQQTEELIKEVFAALNNDIVYCSNLNTALQSLCLIYINKSNNQRNTSKGNSKSKIQEALLLLSPLTRLVLVLREILKLNYSEIAEMTGLKKATITRLLSAGRWTLRKHLAPPPGQSTLPEMYTMAK